DRGADSGELLAEEAGEAARAVNGDRCARLAPLGEPEVDIRPGRERFAEHDRPGAALRVQPGEPRRDARQIWPGGQDDDFRRAPVWVGREMRQSALDAPED